MDTAYFACDRCNVFPYETAEDLRDHMRSHAAEPVIKRAATLREKFGTVVESRQGYETVSTGFGSTTTRPVRAPQKPINAPTERQTAFVRSLLSERAGNEAAEAIRSVLNRHREAKTLTRQVVSNAIEQLLSIPRPRTQSSQSTGDAPQIAEGRYAFTNEDGDTAFCKIDHGKGRWDGYTFVTLLVGSPGSLREIRLARDQQSAILAKIAVDPKSAMARFGQELGICGRCNSPLTDEVSRSIGLGPVCREKL